MKAVISIVGEYTDRYSESGETNLNYGYMRWEDIRNSMSDGTIEFQNHTYALHSNTKGRYGSAKKKWESLIEYPFGKVSKESTDRPSGITTEKLLE